MTPPSEEDRFEVVWPLAPAAPAAETTERPERSQDLAGKRIGFLWDYLFKGDEIFDVVKAEISARYDDVTFVDYHEFGNIHGHDEADVIDRLPIVLRRTGVDSVIAAVGA
jgi:hypothetical protein